LKWRFNNEESHSSLATENEKLFRLLYVYEAITKLTFADSLWLGKDISFKEDYLNTVVKQFYASLYEVDFTENESAELMSQWIYENTGKLLKPEISLLPEQILSIISTIYLKDEWVDLFLEEESGTEPFYLTDNTEIACEFMHRIRDPYSYVDGEGFLSTRLYTKGNMSVQFILQDQGVTPGDILTVPQLLEADLYSEEENNSKMNFHIPKFSFGSSFKLKEILKNMGITTAFEKDADFSLAMNTEQAFISEVQHQTHVELMRRG
jgi:serpin B